LRLNTTYIIVTQCRRLIDTHQTVNCVRSNNLHV